MLAARVFVLVAFAQACVTPLAARAFSVGRGGAHSGNIALRRRLHVNTLIAEPGTMEVEWGTAYATSDTFTLPATLKYTPEGHDILWGRTEYSVSFDAVASSVTGFERTTRFSDRLGLAANCVVFDGEKLDIAVAPQVAFFLRDQDGARAGATALARYDVGRNSAGMTMTWTGATHPSADNPAGTFDIGGGFGRRLAASGWLSHLTPHANLVYERSTGVQGLRSVFEGIEYQITEKLAVDLSGQHFQLAGGGTDHQVVLGLTLNLGHLGHHHQ
jgi:hypothetical protein